MGGNSNRASHKRGNVITNAFSISAEGVFMAKSSGRSPEAVGVEPESRARDS